MKKLKLNRNLILTVVLLLGIVVSVIQIIWAEVPNPGHTWSEIGDVLVSVSQGGTGKSSWTQYAIPFLSDTTTFSEIPIGDAGKYLKSTGTGYTWDTPAGGGTHNLLDSSIHLDTTTGTVTRGAIITGQGTIPTWARLDLGAAGTYLRSDGTDLVYSPIQAADVPGLDASKIISGTFSDDRISSAATWHAKMSNPMTTLGDIIYGGTGGVPTRLAGSAGFLKSTGAAAPTWSAITAGDLPTHTHAAGDITSGVLSVARGGTGLSTVAAGRILYSTAADTWGTLTSTAANQVLRSTGANALEISALTPADIPNLDAAKITSGVFDNARINWASPGAIGATTPAAGTFTTFSWRAGTANTMTLTHSATAARTITFPDATDTVVLLGASQALTGKTYEGLSITTGTDTFTLTRGSSTLTRSGAHALTLTTTAATTATLPSGTVTLMSNPMTTLGDIIYGGTGGVPTRLAGSAGFLKSTGAAAPTWSAITAGDLPTHTHAAGDITSGVLSVARGGTGLDTAATGDIIYASGPNTWARRSIGNTGDVLTVSGGVPVWAPPGGGTAHTMLSATHTDTTIGTVSRGAIITGQGTPPTWTALTLGAAGTYLRSDGTDLVYSPIQAADIPGLDASKITSGVFGVARGGTGLSSPGPAGNVLTSDGTSWLSSPPLTDISFYRRRGATTIERWYTSPYTGTALTTGAPTANVLRAIPFIVPKTITLDRIAINVTTAAAGSARLGIYEDDGNLYPGALVLDAGTVDTGTVGVKAITINQTLTGGKLYWLAIVSNAAPTIRAFAVASMIPILGFDSTLGAAPGLFYSVSFTFGALPSTFPTGATVGTAVPIPAIFVRLSS